MKYFEIRYFWRNRRCFNYSKSWNDAYKKKSRRSFSSYICNQSRLMIIRLFLKRALLLWSLLALRSSHISLYFWFFRKDITLNIDHRISLSSNTALFKEFLRDVTSHDWLQAVRATVWSVMSRARFQDKHQEKHLRQYSRILKNWAR